MDRPTLSQSWNRVARLTPILRPQVQISRQLYRGEPWYVVHDSISNAFFRLNPVAYHLVGLLDGHRTVDQAWNLTIERYGDDAPTQNEVIGLLGQLNSSNLLRVDLPADAEPLLRRSRERKLKKWGGQILNVLFMRIPVANPDSFLKWALPLFRPVLSKWGLLAWLAFIVFALVQFLPSLRLFLTDVNSVLAPANWGWMIVLFIVTKTWHEFGHGIICRRFGGAVPEVGIMLLVLFPAPYVDATSSWSFPSKWRRLLVGAAGMMFELLIAAVAALVWLHADSGTLVRQLAYNVIFLASVTTILFNANPLIRFDGYYMLSDLLEIPNLYDRSTRHLFWMAQRFAYGITTAFPVATTTSERVALTIFGITSGIYRVVLMTGIALFIAGKFFIVGVIMALWTAFTWGLLPVLKLIRWLAVDPQVQRTRVRAVTVTVAALAIIFLLVGMIPAPERRYASGIVESAQRAEIAIQTDGFVTQVKAQSGVAVEKDQIILVLENPDLMARQADLRGQLEGLRYADSSALARDPVEYRINRARIAAVEEALQEIDRQVQDLVLRSPQEGMLVGPNMDSWLGQYVTRGKVICRVADLRQLRVTALVDQGQNDSVFRRGDAKAGDQGPDRAVTGIEKVELRTVGHKDLTVSSSLIRAFDSGRTQLPHPALSYAGGGTIATNPEDPNGQTALRPQFELWLELPPRPAELGGANLSLPLGLPGERVFVRLTLRERNPLLVQWIHRARQLIRDRLAV